MWAIDCTHVQVDLARNECATDFFNKDKNYNFILQAIGDSDTQFFDIFAIFLEVVHDARLVSNFGFKLAMDRGRPSVIGGVSILELHTRDAGFAQNS